jgi:alkylated DNA repair dioxygenase AlkB
MDLFHELGNTNLLPRDGEVVYFGPVFSNAQSEAYYIKLLESIQWENDEAFIFGKRIITKRKVAWYAAKTYNYTYSKVTKTAKIWTPELLAIKRIIEEESGETYNSCLLNLYHSGEEGMGWHRDGEKDLKENGAIASLSLGAERKFVFKHSESKQVVDLILQQGSLLLMKGVTQKYWVHRLPPTKKVKSPRINLTFRTIEDLED